MAKGHNTTQQVYTNKETLQKIYETLDIKKSKYVYDCCMGSGNWLEFEKEFNPNTILLGNEIDKNEAIKAIKRIYKTDNVVEDNTGLAKKYNMITVFKVDKKVTLCLFHGDSSEFKVWNISKETFGNDLFTIDKNKT